MTTPVLVINEATCSLCGMPVQKCECEVACANCGLPESDCECGAYTPSVVENEETEVFDQERPLGMPVMDFQPKGPGPTVRQTTIPTVTDGEETPLGSPTWNFAPADDCPDEAELVGNEGDEQPMSNQTWQF